MSNGHCVGRKELKFQAAVLMSNVLILTPWLCAILKNFIVVHAFRENVLMTLLSI